MPHQRETTDERSSEPPFDIADRAVRLAAELARLAEHQQAATLSAAKITHVGAAVAQKFGLAEILDVVLDETIVTLEARLAYVYLAIEDGHLLALVGQRNVPAELIRKLSEASIDAPLLGARVAASREPYFVPSLAKLDPDLAITHELLSRTGCNSIASLPLLARGELIGVLNFAFAAPHQFSSEERDALNQYAEVFAFSIANARRYEEEHRLRALFEAVGRAAVDIVNELDLTSTLQRIVDNARQVVSASYAALGIATSEDQSFQTWVYSGMTQAQADRIGRLPRPVGTLGLPTKGHTIRIADIRSHPLFQGLPEHHPPITSFLAVPIHHQGEAVGNLYLANKRDPDTFSQEDLRAIELLAAHAGAAVYQAHLKDELGRERSRLRAILESAPHGVIFVEGSTMKILANPRAVELLGRPLPTDVPGQVEYRGEFFTADGKPIPDEDRLARRVMRGEVIPPREILVRQPNGSMRPVGVSVAAVVQGGRIEGAVIVFEDISALKDLQRLREEWAAIITHDLRQPLNVLMLYVNLLQSMPAHPDPEDLLKIANQMQKSAETLNRMTSDLADVSRIETRQLQLNRQLVDLASLAHNVVDQQRLAAGRSISLIVAGEIPSVDADPMRIEQVLVNLLVNAFKYSEPGTAIDVEVRQEGQEARVLVTNRGPTIAADELPQLFDRYYRTARARAGRARGLGLGLNIAKGLIEAHGGRIWAESASGITTFQFALPVVGH